MKIGYVRVSTDEQNLSLQRDALEAAGCAVIYQDEGVSGIAKERHGLAQALAALGAGDTLVVWKLTGWGARSVSCVSWWNGWESRGRGSRASPMALTPPPTAASWCFISWGHWLSSSVILSANARGRACMRAAKKRGKNVGRPRALSLAQVQHMRELLNAGKTQREVAELLGVSANTVGWEVRAKRV